MNSWASCFKGYWRSLHWLAFPTARRYFSLHTKPFDFTGAGTHGAMCDPTFFHCFYQWTGIMFSCDIKKLDFIPPINGVGFPAHSDKFVSNYINKFNVYFDTVNVSNYGNL